MKINIFEKFISCCIFKYYRYQTRKALKVARYPENQCELPNFCRTASIKSPYLALLQDPGKSGAVDSRKCSLDNTDGTSRNQIDIIGKAGVSRYDIVFWNFYAAFGFTSRSKNAKQFWGKQLDKLLKLLTNVKAVVVCGNVARDGVCAYYQCHPTSNNPERLEISIHGRDIHFMFSPHPGDQAAISVGSIEKVKHKCATAWLAAKEVVSPSS